MKSPKLSRSPTATKPPGRARVRGLGSKLKTFALALAGIAVALLLSESLVRWIRPQQLILIRPDIWQPHDGLGWVMAPNLKTRVNTGEGQVCLRTDESGWRVPCEPSKSGGPEVLVLGDSFVVALQVEAEEVFTHLLGERLTRRRAERIHTVSAAVAGWGPSHYLIAANQELMKKEFRAILVAVFLGNDLEVTRHSRFPPRVATVRHAFHWPTEFSRREIVSGLLYPTNNWLEQRSHLFLLFRTSAWHLLMRAGLSARRFPTACLITERESERWRVTAEALRDIDGLARANDIPILFLLIPGAYQVDTDLGLKYASALGLSPSEIDLDQPSKRLLEEPALEDLEVIDATTSMRKALQESGEPLHGAIDTHLSRAGHRFLADLVAARLEELLQEGR